MADQIQSTIDSKSLVLKLKANLEKINTRLAGTNNTGIGIALAEANAAFKNFFDGLADPEFDPEFFISGDTARSETYNNNLQAISNDIERFYQEIKSLGQAQIKSYNFSQIVISEITQRANALASIVLDLNILNNYNRGDTIVAGDDFKTLNYIDDSIALASPKASIISNGSGLGLAAAGTQNVLDGARIEVQPLSPANSNGAVNNNPTPGNLERFYEGCYYNFIGLARPEGGKNFSIKYIIDPASIPAVGEATEVGYYVDLGAQEDVKAQVRKKMFDGDPSTFWECEFLYRTPEPLIPDIPDTVVVDNEGTAKQDHEIRSGSVKIDLVEAERVARQYDTDTKDLVIDLVITFPGVTSVNYVGINPVIFGSQAFPEVEDISTADNEGEFKTVDGWDSIRFPKTITPEANEFLTDSQLAITLAPSRNSYVGQGIYSFPVRFAKKVKIRLRCRYPVAAPYERTYALLKHQITTDLTITTTTKKGLLRF